MNDGNGSQISPDPDAGSDGSSDSWYKGGDAVKSRLRAGTSRGQAGRMPATGGRGKKKASALDELLIRFSLEKWKPGVPHYRRAPLPFLGATAGCTHPYGRLPSVLGLFQKFWSEKV